MRLMIRFNRILLCAGMILAMLPFVGYGVAMAQQDTASFQEETVAGIPRVMLTVDPDALQSVLDSRDHTYRAKGGSVSVELPEGYAGEFGEIDPLGIGVQLPLKFLRGRGNSTWLSDKRSFKFKLKERVSLLGMGESKHWILVCNTFDDSLLRNRLVFYIGRELGLAFTPKALPVDLYINGEYAGSYLLSQDIRISRANVAIDEIDPLAVREPEISGGYLLAMNPYPRERVENTFTTHGGVRFLMNEPEFASDDPTDDLGTAEQREYITSYLQKTENAIYGENFRDADGIPYTEYMDIESAARFWWLQEFCINEDAFRSSSTYLYKPRNGKLCWGPLWDFDIALNPTMYADTFNYTQMPWLDYLRENEPQYQALLRRTWAELEPILDKVVADGGVIDQYAAQIRQSWIRNNERWHITEAEGLDAQVVELKQFIQERRRFVRENLNASLTLVDAAVPPRTAQTEMVTAGEGSEMARGVSGTCAWVIDAKGHMTVAPLDGISGELDDWENSAERPWYHYMRKITGVTFEGRVRAKTCLAMFYGCYYLTDIDLSGLDTSQVSNMRGMFAWCWSLQGLDLSTLDTSNATNMREMFLACNSLTSLDLRGFETSGVTDMRNMFYRCYHLHSIDLSELDTSNVTDMTAMFADCLVLGGVDLSAFDTGNVTTMRSMFYRCRSLTALDLSGFDLSNVVSIAFMFAECDNLAALDLPGLDMNNMQDVSCTFLCCPKLNLTGFDMPEIDPA